jgi:salicylate hydroxylase
VHYPLRGGEQYNVVVTFHSRADEEWGVREGSRDEVQGYFDGICAKARQLIDLPKDWKRWATADREPIGQWTFGRATLLGDAAHPTLQYLAQGANMAIEDAVVLAAYAEITSFDWEKTFKLYEDARYKRTARVQIMSRYYGDAYHAAGVVRELRNDILAPVPNAPPDFDSVAWLYDGIALPQAAKR